MAESKHVLVVDDDLDFVDAVATLLRREGHVVSVGHDGFEAIAKARELKPDAIVLDVMMPGKDGYVACKELKAAEDTRDIPILLLTAVAAHVTSTNYTPHDGLTTPADDWLDKGAEPEEIVERVRDLLS